MKERVIWIDQLRGFCIFLMLLGHVAVPKPVNNYIYSFHMPLFFIISGMTLNYDRLLEYDFKSYFIKRIKGYIIPYLFLNFTAIPIYWFVKSILQGSELSILRMLFGISMANYLTGFEHPAGPSWFLPTLFLAHMIFYMFVKLSKGDKRFVILFCAVSALIGFTERKTNLPLHLGTAFSGCMFMFIGSVLKPVIELSVRKKMWGGGSLVLHDFRLPVPLCKWTNIHACEYIWKAFSLILLYTLLFCIWTFAFVLPSAQN